MFFIGKGKKYENDTVYQKVNDKPTNEDAYHLGDCHMSKSAFHFFKA